MSKVKAVKAISLLWLGSIMGAGCAFLTQVILARSLDLQVFTLHLLCEFKMCRLVLLVVNRFVKSLSLNTKRSIIFP